MQVRITDLTEQEVFKFAAELNRAGLENDEHFDVIYGAGWTLCGFEFRNADDAETFFSIYRREQRRQHALWA